MGRIKNKILRLIKMMFKSKNQKGPLSTLPLDYMTGFNKGSDSIPLSDIEREFAENGYLIIKNAVSLESIMNFKVDLERAKEGFNFPKHVLYQRHGSGEVANIQECPKDELQKIRLVDSYVALDSAKDILLSDKIINTLKSLFRENPKLFQSLSFLYGSQQGLHQDTAYVVTEPPLNLVGVWIALEDIQRGSGELRYLQNSHKLPLFFMEKTGKVHYDANNDRPGLHKDYSQFLNNSLEGDKFCKNLTFLPKKGDALIWHSQLAHGGSPITGDFTRESIVGHFCPDSTQPNWYDSSHSWNVKYKTHNISMVSQYFSQTK